MKRDELRALLAEAGIRPSKIKGQNFLVEESLAQAIARDGEIGPDDVVLEVGTGFGILTRFLLADAAHVVTVEKDALVAAQARRLLGDDPQLTLLETDVLASKSEVEPAVLDAVRARLAELRAAGRDPQLRVIANLPYAIATPLVVGLLAADLPLAGMAVMVQLEAAQRFAADTGDAAYGSVSVLCRALCDDVRVVRKVPREVFHPRPKVTSAVVRFVPRADRHAGFVGLSRTVRALFNFRRKTVLNAARSVARGDPTLDGLAAAIEPAGLDPTRRTEDLSLQDFRRLAAVVFADG